MLSDADIIDLLEQALERLPLGIAVKVSHPDEFRRRCLTIVKIAQDQGIRSYDKLVFLKSAVSTEEIVISNEQTKKTI